MKYLFCVLVSGFIFIVYSKAPAQNSVVVTNNPNQIDDTSKKSIKMMAIGIVNGDTIKINYHSPGVRKRVIWGGLVPYDEVWVTGAHNATAIEISKPFILNGEEIPSGTYAIFTIPGKKTWTIIINKHWEQHLTSEYDEKDDVVRIKVKPKKINHTERLHYFIETGKNNNAIIAVAWEKVRIEFPIIIK